jgi:hypothetical protein
MFVPFPKIHAYHDAISHARRTRELDARRPGETLYRGTVKLHGSNAGVRVPRDGAIYPQSRNRALDLASDNFGFAAFAFAQEQAIQEIARLVKTRVGVRDLTLFGEWIGPGVQKGVAIAQLPARQWVLFAVAATEFAVPVFFDMCQIGQLSCPEAGIYNVLDAGDVTIPIDLSSPASCTRAAEAINEHTQRVEDACPWAARFGLDGIGEGLVWTPIGGYEDPGLCFKSKGVKHKGEPGSRLVKAASPTAEQFASIDAFVAVAVDSERVAQGVAYMREVGRPIDMTTTGAFLDWIVGDVFAEMQWEILALNVDSPPLRKAITAAAARAWRGTVAAEAAQ